MTAQQPVTIRWAGLVGNLVVNGLCPLLTYVILRSVVPRISPITALAVGAAFPATKGIVDLTRQRTLNIISAMVLAGILVGIVATAIRNPTLLLLRDSLVSGAFGVVCLLSLSWSHPLMFYVSRQLAADGDPAGVSAFNARWQSPRARQTFRLLTVVWAIGWIAQFVLAAIMVRALSVAHVLAAMAIVLNGISLGTIAWSVVYLNRRQRENDLS